MNSTDVDDNVNVLGNLIFATENGILLCVAIEGGDGNSDT